MCFWMMTKITGFITGEPKKEVDEVITLAVREPQPRTISVSDYVCIRTFDKAAVQPQSGPGEGGSGSRNRDQFAGERDGCRRSCSRWRECGDCTESALDADLFGRTNTTVTRDISKSGCVGRTHGV